MSVSHLSPEQRRLNGQIGGRASAAKASVRRLEKWQQWGVPPEVGERIYMAGYACRVAQERRKKKLGGTRLTAVDEVSVSASGQLPHVVALRHLLDVASYHTCDLDHFATVRNVVKGLESGTVLLVSRANAESALNDARVCGQWREHKGANSLEAKTLETRARLMVGLDSGSGTDASEAKPSAPARRSETT